MYVAYCETEKGLEETARCIARFSRAAAGVIQRERGLEFQVGVHSGEIAAGTLSRLNPKLSLVGDTINVSARLCFAADWNTVLMSEESYKLSGESQGVLRCINV